MTSSATPTAGDKQALVARLRQERAAGVRGGIYHRLQVEMTYNSNHIEGSQLTQEQTRLIFETSTIFAPSIALSTPSVHLLMKPT